MSFHAKWKVWILHYSKMRNSYIKSISGISTVSVSKSRQKNRVIVKNQIVQFYDRLRYFNIFDLIRIYSNFIMLNAILKKIKALKTASKILKNKKKYFIFTGCFLCLPLFEANNSSKNYTRWTNSGIFHNYIHGVMW